MGNPIGDRHLEALGAPVDVDLDVSDQRLARKGGRVEVELPTGERIAGTVTSVGSVAHAEQDDRGQYSGKATLDVGITLDAGAAASAKGAIDRSPVTVWLTADERRGVLAVPVAALLALGEGGYGVQVVRPDGTSSVVAVRVGGQIIPDSAVHGLLNLIQLALIFNFVACLLMTAAGADIVTSISGVAARWM